MFGINLERKSKHTFCVQELFSENRAVYEIMWKTTVESDRRQTRMWRVRIARWVPNATNTNPEYVIHVAFPLQQWLQERASILRSYVYCLACY
jgi:hypothetical protein